LDKVPAKWLSGNIKIPRKWLLLGAESEQWKLMAEVAIEFESHCSTAWGLKASFIGTRGRPGHVNPKTNKVGMATSGVTKGRASEIVDLNSRESKSLLKLLREKFDLAEQEAIRMGDPLYTGHPTLKNERVNKPFKPKKIFRMKTKQAKQTLYFISIVRHYEQLKREENYDCYAESLFNVWVLNNDQQYKIAAADMILTDCDGREGRWINPLGVLSIENKEYITSLELGYESESYMDKGALKTVLFVRGGC
jgi:hypothetical protein